MCASVNCDVTRRWLHTNGSQPGGAASAKLCGRARHASDPEHKRVCVSEQHCTALLTDVGITDAAVCTRAQTNALRVQRWADDPSCEQRRATAWPQAATAALMSAVVCVSVHPEALRECCYAHRAQRQQTGSARHADRASAPQLRMALAIPLQTRRFDEVNPLLQVPMRAGMRSEACSEG